MYLRIATSGNLRAWIPGVHSTGLENIKRPRPLEATPKFVRW